MPNKRMRFCMEESMLRVCRELRRIERAGDMSDELASLAGQICSIPIGLGHDPEEAVMRSDAELIEGMECWMVRPLEARTAQDLMTDSFVEEPVRIEG